MSDFNCLLRFLNPAHHHTPRPVPPKEFDFFSQPKGVQSETCQVWSLFDYYVIIQYHSSFLKKLVAGEAFNFLELNRPPHGHIWEKIKSRRSDVNVLSHRNLEFACSVDTENDRLWCTPGHTSSRLPSSGMSVPNRYASEHSTLTHVCYFGVALTLSCLQPDMYKSNLCL